MKNRPPMLLALVATSSAISACGADGLDADRPAGALGGPAAIDQVSIELVVDGLGEGRLGSALAPDGSLIVTTGMESSVIRVDLSNGSTTLISDDFPATESPIGGVVDVEMRDDGQLLALTSMVRGDDGRIGAFVHTIEPTDGGAARVDVAIDVGRHQRANLPAMEVGVGAGVPDDLEFHDGILHISDSHHNRVLRVDASGELTDAVAFGNVVPTGMASLDDTLHIALAGPVPHRPEDGRVVGHVPSSDSAEEIAAGARLPVDLAVGSGGQLLVLAQGFHDGVGIGSPAQPSTGEILEIGEDGTMHVLVGGLDRPTSMTVIGTDVYVTTLTGELLRVIGIG